MRTEIKSELKSVGIWVDQILCVFDDI